MLVSRRNILCTIGVGTTAQAAGQMPFGRVYRASNSEPPRPRESGEPILLNSNENVYGPSTKVVAVMYSALAVANRYPFMEYGDLTNRIASFHGIKPERVLLGCGSTEIIRAAAMAFLSVGEYLLQPSPTFEAVEHYARSAGAKVVSVPLNREFAHDLDGMLERVGSWTTLVYICNPNNPTASLTPRKDLEAFINKLPSSTHVLIDEAYHHYAGQSAMYASFIDHPVNDERVIVTRTFSTVYGLAGLRLGYAIASSAIVARMRPYITTDSVNSIVVRAATAALDDTDSVREFVKRYTDDRQEFFNQAVARMIKPIDSHANFVMMNTHMPAEEVIEHFRKNHILIGRRFPAMDKYIRVSLGTPEDMRAFWRTWDKLVIPKDRMVP
jgi:histidinol-phosphate aminotransferase